jgi:probable phosphoglycerate mutase
VSSPFVRARQTAEIIAASLALPMSIENDLRERSYGTYAGLPYETARPDFDPHAYWQWRPPGGETLEEVAARVGRALDRIAAQANHDDAVVVSHGGVMMALWRHVMGEWARPGRVVRNAGILLVDHEGGRYHAARLLDSP